MKKPKDDGVVTIPQVLYKRIRFIIQGIAIMGTRELDANLLEEFRQLAGELDLLEAKHKPIILKR